MADKPTRWGMVVDLDRCTGCEACVVACQAENNVPFNEEDIVREGRARLWIRIERYWEGEYPNIKARYLPVLCQQCNNAPCEPVCPVYASVHNQEGLNVQVYNRCVGTRYCANNCPYLVRFFNYWQREWPEPFTWQLNPDVTVRSRGIMEKCTFCIQRIHSVERNAKREKRAVRDGEVQPACVQACTTNALIFGNLYDEQSKVAQLAKDQRGYRLLEELATDTGIVYLKKVDPSASQRS